MKYQWLLFDADETLFNFQQAEENALKWTLAHFNITFTPEYIPLYAKFNQRVWKEFERGEVSSQELRVKRFRLFFEELGMDGDMPAISQLYLQNLALGIDLVEGAEEVINTLKKQHHLAIVTNGIKEVQRSRLERSVLRNSFEHLFISEEIGAAKPSPAFFDHVFESTGQPARETVLIIGDSLSSDIKGGLNYGIDTCWFNPNGGVTDLPVTYQITRLNQLLDIVR